MLPARRAGTTERRSSGVGDAAFAAAPARAPAAPGAGGHGSERLVAAPGGSGGHGSESLLAAIFAASPGPAAAAAAAPAGHSPWAAASVEETVRRAWHAGRLAAGRAARGEDLPRFCGTCKWREADFVFNRPDGSWSIVTHICLPCFREKQASFSAARAPACSRFCWQ